MTLCTYSTYLWDLNAILYLHSFEFHTTKNKIHDLESKIKETLCYFEISCLHKKCTQMKDSRQYDVFTWKINKDINI